MNVTPPTDEQRELIVRNIIREGRTREQALKMIGRWLEGAPIELETVACTNCIAGYASSPRCMGSDIVRCPKCRGTGEVARFKLPFEE